MKSFSEIYGNVLKNNKRELEGKRKKVLFRLIVGIIIIASIVVFVFFKTNEGYIIVPVIMISMILFALWVHKPSQNYTNIYKEKVVKNFIKEYDENLNFAPKGGIPEMIYRSAGFESIYDIYHTEDLISGEIDNHKIIMGEVHTQREEETTDSDGNTTTQNVTLFQGMFGYIKINNIYNGEMRIHADKGKLAKIFGDQKRIEMDSSEFEKYFDVYAEDKVQAMQVLTSDIMEELIKFRTEHKIKFEITINHNNLYIRFHTGPMFEANILRSSVNINTLAKVYNIINFTFNITRKFVKVSEETEI